MQDNNTENLIVLQDLRTDGEERPHQEKKKMSLHEAEHYERGYEIYGESQLQRKAERMRECANVLRFQKQQNGELKLYQAWYCKGRFCSMCNWRRSLKIAAQNKRIVETINERHKVRWLFLTLTVKNVNGDELRDTLTQMTDKFRRLMDYKPVKRSILGFFRGLEITYDYEKLITKKRYDKNPKYYKKQGLKPGDSNPNFGKYHPHFHVLLCVKPSYFSMKDYYIKQKDWQVMWKRAMKLDYDPIVDIRPVKPKSGQVDLAQVEAEVSDAIKEQKAIFEASKYPVKATDIIQDWDVVRDEAVETLYTLDTATAYKRLIGYGGLLKDVHAELKMDDAEEGDLVKVDDEEDDEISNAIMEVVAYWHYGLRNYVIKTDL